MANTILISKDKSIIIDYCDGKETLADAKDVFKSGISSDFKNWNTNKLDKDTEETAVQVHEIVKDSTFVQMFDSLGTDLDKLCLTQSQIKNFCKKNPNWLRPDGYATTFLFKVDDQFLIARVRVYPGGLYVRALRLDDSSVWLAKYALRVVVPQLVI